MHSRTADNEVERRSRKEEWKGGASDDILVGTKIKCYFTSEEREERRESRINQE
jgi:hypothetical protein